MTELKSPIQVSLAESSSIDFIIQSQIQMARETERMELDIATVTKGVNAVFSNPSIGNYFIASKDGKQIACLLTLPEWSDWRNGKVLWIHSVFVLPEYRKLGVYSCMYAHLKKMVSESSEYRGLRLYVDKSNGGAQKVYEKLGMNKDHYELYEWMK